MNATQVLIKKEIINHSEIIKIAYELMREHKLSVDWEFRFNNTTSNIAQCNYDKAIIQFSNSYVSLLSQKEIINIILHEIAHALVGAGHNHDAVWQKKALEIGCDGKRLYNGEIVYPSKYIAKCKYCDNVYYRMRLPKNNRTYSCCKCDSIYNPKYILNWVEK
jgi:predicted SprT family Zn-dependent metalloprotease